VVSHSYKSASTLSQGSIVTINGSNVELANSNSTTYPPLAVVVPAGSTLVELKASDSAVEAVSEGTVPTLVSDVNGAVHKGDVLTLAPIPGTAMKRLQTGRTLGVAQVDLDAATTTTQQTVTVQGGGQRQIKLGLISVTLSNGNDGNSVGNIPSWIRGFANGLAGHQVSDARVLASVVIFVAAIVWTVVLIYSAVVGGILATGRNPLSGGWVFMNILGLLVYVSVIMAVTLGLVYTLLHS
jgi:hypothetical protein